MVALAESMKGVSIIVKTHGTNTINDNIIANMIFLTSLLTANLPPRSQRSR
jgi:phosphoribosylpyrophosphate synthetase